MSSSDVAIAVRGLSKSYTIAHTTERHNTMASVVAHKLRHPFERIEKETFWALKDVSFDVHKGDVVGIIGRNGAGKSTLLKILSRITEPTTGVVGLYGRVGSLLEVGTGFHPELTGRENVYMNGAILGMSRREIAEQFDAIVDFANVASFLDTPVKRYSSGMYVRLAFAVAAHLNPEILIVDEVLAVGDAEFQKKCLGKMHEVAAGGRTVLFVSHNIQAISTLCSRAVLLTGGGLEFAGGARETIERYISTFGKAFRSERPAAPRAGTGEYRFEYVCSARTSYGAAEPKCFNYRIVRTKPTQIVMYTSAHIIDEGGATIAQCDSRLVGYGVGTTPEAEGQFKFMSPWLKPGGYRLDVYLCAVGVGIVDKFEDACRFEVSPVLPYDCSASEDALQYGAVLSDFSWMPSTDGRPA
jgi:lipopolysaccharide transport system ATP-binding protein